MSRRSGLGRGLDALIPDQPTGSPDTGVTLGDGAVVLVEVALDAIDPNPHQPRVQFTDEALEELATSIAHLGVLQPVLVHRGDDGRFRLIAGERRWRAARRAGLATIPAVVRSVPDTVTVVEQALVENLHREDLTPLEEAAAYLQLVEEFELTHEQIAGRVGKNRSTISNTLRLLSLPNDVQRLLADGELSAGHAKALLGCSDRERQSQLAAQLVAESWSVRATEQAVRAAAAPPEQVEALAETPAESPRPAPPSADGGTIIGTSRAASLLEIERLLEDRLSTRIRADYSGRRGRLVIEFADLDDLGRIYQILVPTSESPSEE